MAISGLEIPRGRGRWRVTYGIERFNMLKDNLCYKKDYFKVMTESSLLAIITSQFDS
jgi:hypothetical protein